MLEFTGMLQECIITKMSLSVMLKKWKILGWVFTLKEINKKFKIMKKNRFFIVNKLVFNNIKLFKTKLLTYK